MKQIYEKVLTQIILQSKLRNYFDGCHKHRIVPGYDGGEYVESNIVFLTQQEHSVVHFLRWKLYKDMRDRRAYKLIGVGPTGLSHEDRVDHGKMCFQSEVGIHGVERHLRLMWQQKGRDTQRAAAGLGEKNWYYWSTQEGRKERASLGGKASYGKNQVFIDQQGAFKDKARASIAARKSAKKPVTDGCGTLRKFHTEEEVDKFLLENPTWRRGCPTRKEKLVLAK